MKENNDKVCAINMIMSYLIKDNNNDNKLNIKEYLILSTNDTFNMKGQIFEKNIALYLQNLFKDNNNITIKIPENKKNADIIISYLEINFPLSIKNYELNRIQIDTFVKNDFYKNTLIKTLKNKGINDINIKNTSNKMLEITELSNEDKNKIIEQLKKDLLSKCIYFGIIKKNKENFNTYFSHLNKDFLSNIDKIKIIQSSGKTSHYRFFFYDNKDNKVFTFDFGENALNRGFWFNFKSKLKSDFDMSNNNIFQNLINDEINYNHYLKTNSINIEELYLEKMGEMKMEENKKKNGRK